MKKISNRNGSEHTSVKLEFNGNNTFARWENGAYVVYSYGCHFPMFVYRGTQWYENSDKYSISTSKQQSQSKPNARTKPLNTKQLKNLIYYKSLNNGSK